VKVGRIVRTADFERVLAQRPCSRSVHFAAHHLAAKPSLPAGPHAVQSLRTELSTGDAPNCPLPVDELPGGCWLGTVVPKRHARRAVTRNLLKRQMRAVLADHADRLPAGLWVLRLKAPFDPRQFPSAASRPLQVSARAELAQLLRLAATAR
jgi:ribonuclease P protein component